MSAVDVFILDDGFQHRQLARDMDLLLLGSDSTGWVLPSGPFREPKKAIGRADFLLITGAQDKWERVISEAKHGWFSMVPSTGGFDRIRVTTLERVSIESPGGPENRRRHRHCESGAVLSDAFRLGGRNS